MASKLFQSIVSQMHGTVGRMIGVLDAQGTVVACSDLTRIGEDDSANMPSVGGYTYSTAISAGKTYRAIGNDIRPEYVIFVEGGDEFADKMAGVLSIALGSVREYYNEHYSRADFLKNIVLDNIRDSDIALKAKQLRFLGEVDRVVILLRMVDKVDLASLEMVSSLFPEKQKDYVLSINEHDILLIKEVYPGVEPKHLEQLALSIISMLEGELYVHTCAGIGTVVRDLRDLNRSYKEAQIAIEIGKIFEKKKNIVSYNKLGVGRLIYQMPTTLCEMFLREVFDRGSVESLDQEILFTINKFFENNLNVSETARKLFVHRNTLVYRLDKIQRVTGLDIREFEDAIIFKMALLVRKYLSSKPTQF